MNNILLIDDNREIHNSLRPIAAAHGYSLLSAYDGLSGLSMAQSCGADIIILDVMLPQSNGFALCRKIREAGCDTPVIFLTAKSDIVDKSIGFEAGGDDYMTKPFSPAELLARLGALTRRQGDVVFETLTVGDLTLNLESMDLTCGDESIRLSQKEFAIARILLGSPGAVLSKEQLISRAWGPSSSASDNNVEAYISFLRKKMAHVGSKAKIETIRSVGYRLAEEG